MTKMQSIQEAERRGRRRGRSGTSLIVAVLVAVVSMALAGPALAAEPPSVNHVEPQEGPPAGGTTVTLTGTNFTGATAVNFGSTSAESFQVISASEIRAVSPPGKPGYPTGLVYVTVTTPSGTSSTNSGNQFVYQPIITSIAPNSGAQGTRVTIHGEGFAMPPPPPPPFLPPTGDAVYFGSTQAGTVANGKVIVYSNTELSTEAPAGSGTVDVRVFNEEGQSPLTSADQFTYIPQPTVTKVEPNAGPAIGGTSLTITGTNLAAATAVKFGSSSTESFTVNSETSITAFSPPGTGTVDVTVTTPSGTSATSEADRFTYGPPAASAERLYVTDFGANTIWLFDLGAEGQLLENRTLAFPNEVQSPRPVVISSDGSSLYVGTHINAGTVSQFTVASNGTLNLKEPPWVETEVHEPEGLALSPDGTSLYAADATTGGGEPGFLTQYTVGSGGLLSLKAPPTVAAGAGTVSDVAVAPNGASVYASDFGGNTISQYSVGAGGVLSPLTPATVPSGTNPVSIAITPDGGSLYAVDKALVGGTSAVSQYSIGPGGALSPKTPATVPTGPEPAAVAVSPDGKNVYVSDKAEKGEISQYTVEPGGALTPKSPASVPAERQPAGLAISPDGKNLYVAEEISSTISQYHVEANGGLSLLATARAGRFPNAIAFASNRPRVTKLEPNHGSAAGGTMVTITGSNLTGATAVKFGSSEAASFTVNSETSITAVSPAGTGVVDVTVTTPGGTSLTSSADQFNYGPTVTKVEPNHGGSGGGTTVTITGTGFTGASAVKFGSASAKSFTVNSATSITAVSPKGKGTVDVTVTTTAGTSPTSAADQFTYSKK